MNWYQAFFFLLGHVYLGILWFKTVRWIIRGGWQKEHTHSTRNPEL